VGYREAISATDSTVAWIGIPPMIQLQIVPPGPETPRFRERVDAMEGMIATMETATAKQEMKLRSCVV